MNKKQEITTEQSNGFGITGLVLGLVGLVILPPFFGVLAIIFSSIGMAKHQKYSKAGLILGIVDLLWMFVLMYLFVFFTAAVV